MLLSGCGTIFIGGKIITSVDPSFIPNTSVKYKTLRLAGYGLTIMNGRAWPGWDNPQTEVGHIGVTSTFAAS